MLNNEWKSTAAACAQNTALRLIAATLIVTITIGSGAASAAASTLGDHTVAAARTSSPMMNVAITAVTALSGTDSTTSDTPASTTGEADTAPAVDVEAAWAWSCHADGGVADLVVRRFYCTARDHGISPDTARTIATEALIVADCESGLDPTAIVFDGAYLHRTHPRTGYQYSAAGVFQFIRTTADRWIDGGYANAHDARANIDAAVDLHFHNALAGRDGWAPWACAAANDGFRHSNVLDETPAPWIHDTVTRVVGALPRA